MTDPREIIRKIRNGPSVFENESLWWPGIANLAADALESLLPISLKDDLPPENEWVIVWNKAWPDLAGTARRKGSMFCNDNWHRSVAVADYSHWLHIPKLPKEAT